MFPLPTLERTDIGFRVKQYFQLLKFRLSALVVFSGGFGYLLAQKGDIKWAGFGLFCLGSFLVTGAANTINQIIEKDLDKLMRRTADRPLPAGRLNPQEAGIYALLLALIGTLFVAVGANLLAAVLGLISLLLYAFVYTPLKQKSPIAVFVGAFPGAFPPLIGWVAYTGEFSIEAFILFAIQFIWQFPHFWAIAWVADEDYKRAGFRLLPAQGEKNWHTALQIMIYTMFLIPLSLLPAQFGMAGVYSAVFSMSCGFLFLLQSFYLLRMRNDKAALRIMFGSFLYLPLVQIALLIDKL
jgi:heme o synthase